MKKGQIVKDSIPFMSYEVLQVLKNGQLEVRAFSKAGEHGIRTINKSYLTKGR